MNYYAVVILYNKMIQESQSIQQLLAIEEHNIHIIVLDNSQDDYIDKNCEWCGARTIKYYPMGENVGLSKAYNYALNLLKNKNENDIVIWFDDDTPVPKEYFNILESKVIENVYDVYAPIIYGQDGIIYSPNETGLLKGKYMKTPNQRIKNSKFNAINSCLAVRLKVYKDYSYDESLFMDCVDMKLFDDFRKMKIKFCILPVAIHQNFFQRNPNNDEEKYWKRFQIRIRDTVVYSLKGNILRRISGIIRIYSWAVVYGIKLKSFSFFQNCIVLGTKLIVTLK